MVRLKNIFDSRKLLKDFGASLQFEKGIEKTVMWYLFSKITPSLFTLKEDSTSHLGLLPSGKKRETAPPRRSEPLRYKVGGASKPCAMFCGMGPPGNDLLILLFRERKGTTDFTNLHRFGPMRPGIT